MSALDIDLDHINTYSVFFSSANRAALIEDIRERHGFPLRIDVNGKLRYVIPDEAAVPSRSIAFDCGALGIVEVGVKCYLMRYDKGAR